MSEPAKIYTTALAKKFRYYATWAPGIPLKLGDYGILEDGYRFRLIGNIKDDFNIDYRVRKDETTDKISYTSKKGVDINTHVSTSADFPLGQGEVGISYKFSSEGAFIFQADGLAYDLIENLYGVGDEIMTLYKENKWQKRFRLITELARASSTSIFVSNDKSSEFQIAGKGDIAGSLDITDLSAGLRFGKRSSMAAEILAKEGLSPLYRVSGIRKPFLRRTRFDSIGALTTAVAHPEHALSGDERMEHDIDKVISGEDAERLYFGDDQFEGLFFNDEG